MRSRVSASVSTPSRARMSARWPDQLVVRQQRELEVLGARADRRAAPSADRWWRARTRRARAALRASSAACSMPPSRACAPRRRCRPCACWWRRCPRFTFWMRSRIASTPLLEAASSSTRSKNVPGRDRQAVLALAARLAVGAEVEAVQRAGEDARGRGLAGAARTREEVRVTGPILTHRVLQRARDVILTDQLREVLGPVLAIQATTRRRCYRRGVRCHRPARAMSGPARRVPVNRVRSGRKQLSAEAPECRRVA